LRLEPLADKIIHKAQYAFIKGRNIMNSVLALHEIMHETKRKKEVGVVLKLDFKKAYDKVHWSFLIKCLHKAGFSETWCNWIKK
jgi:retron-type reverse transcriptase